MNQLADWLLRFLGLSRNPGRRDAIAAHRQTHPVGWSTMATLLDDLDQLADAHSEVLDTAVREQLAELAETLVVRREGPVNIPRELGMFTPEGDAQLRALLTENFVRIRETFAVFELDTPKKRAVSFRNPRLRSARGSAIETYFGAP